MEDVSHYSLSPEGERVRGQARVPFTPSLTLHRKRGREDLGTIRKRSAISASSVRVLPR